jgi:hypothetical protein
MKIHPSKMEGFFISLKCVQKSVIPLNPIQYCFLLVTYHSSPFRHPIGISSRNKNNETKKPTTPAHHHPCGVCELTGYRLINQTSLNNVYANNYSITQRAYLLLAFF